MTATEGGGIFFKVAMYVKRQIDGDEQNNAEMFWIFPLLSQIFEKPRANILSLCFFTNVSVKNKIPKWIFFHNLSAKYLMPPQKIRFF